MIGRASSRFLRRNRQTPAARSAGTRPICQGRVRASRTEASGLGRRASAAETGTDNRTEGRIDRRARATRGVSEVEARARSARGWARGATAGVATGCDAVNAGTAVATGAAPAGGASATGEPASIGAGAGASPAGKAGVGAADT